MRERVQRTVASLAASLALATATLWPGPSAMADESTTLKERQHERAGELREQSKARAAARLGYPSVFAPVPQFPSDYFYTLSLQIARLANLLDTMNLDRAGTPEGAAPNAAPRLTPPGAGAMDVNSVYGPDGPTVKAVRLLLEYQLLRLGNPRLKIGRVEDGDGVITAEIVTVDGSLVEEYAVDKSTGAWRPKR